MISNHFHILVSVCAVALCGCLGEVEHTNPLDPNSPGFDSVGTVQGQTTRFYPPYAPIGGADVKLGEFIAESDQEGRFVFPDVPVGEYQLSARTNGFASLTENVTVELGTPVEELNVRLDGLPVVQSTAVQSIHISQWFPTEDLFMVEAVAIVDDPDGVGDIDSVWVEIPEEGYSQGLAEGRVAGRFAVDLSIEELPREDLYALQGAAFVFHARDQAGLVATSEPTHIFRIIDYTPVAVDPQGQVSLSDPTPTLSWEDAALPFQYTYRLDIYRDQANVQTLVDSITEIAADELSYELETPLTSGTYFWTVWVVDQHGNRSRSKEAGFIIE